MWEDLAAADLLLLSLCVTVVWRWVGPATPIRRGVPIALACAVAGVGVFLALAGVGSPILAYLAAACFALTALDVVPVPLVGRLARAPAPDASDTNP
jgi:hypothetical protein